MQAANGSVNDENVGQYSGVNVAVESQSEWQINYIQYDGTECFIPPPDFADVVAKNVGKIKWNDIIDNPSSLDRDDQEEASDGDEAKNLAKVEKELMAFDSVREAAKDRAPTKSLQNSASTPTAGPWAAVAKSLHESLQEVDVLLDLLRVSRTPYLNVMQVAPPLEEKSADVLNKSKSFLWVSRRKSFQDALSILDTATKARPRSDQRPLYFSELKAMRENWRIRKVGEFVFGDLGYKIYGPKFAQGELFDIFWDPNAKQSSKGGPCRSIQVQLPKNLVKRTDLAVSLIKDDADYQSKIFNDSSNQAQSIYYTDNYRDLPWEVTLKWAQESLINRDIFTQLMKEAVDEKHICIVTENSIIVCLTNGMLLKFERLFYPFQEMEIPQSGDPYLSSALYDIFVRDVIRPPHRPQQFVGLPITTLPESLDLRGPQGLSAEEIASRVEKTSPLLTRMIDVANHYILSDQVTGVLNRQMISRSDPQLSWRWVRSTSTFSIIAGSITNQCYEPMGKLSFIIKIGDNEVTFVAKDSLVINCHREMKLLQETLDLVASNCQLTAASTLAKMYCWQILHTNTNAFCKEGSPAPTFYACNQTATKKIFIQFFTDGRPYQIYIKRMNPNAASDLKQEQDEPMDTNVELDKFVPVNNARVQGDAFLRKLDYIYTMCGT